MRHSPAPDATINAMGFLQSFVLAFVLAVTSFITAPLGFFHVSQSPTVEVSPVTGSTQFLLSRRRTVSGSVQVVLT